MGPYPPEIPTPRKEGGSWLPVLAFCVIILAWIGMILQPVLLVLLETKGN